jgi:hypothetical protein
MDPSKERPVPERRNEPGDAVTRFLDGLYIPEKLRNPLSLVPTLRSRSGNRTNVKAVASERFEDEKKAIQWTKVLMVRRREDDDLTVFFGNCMVVSAMLALLFLSGLGVRKALTPEDVANVTNPKVFSMVSKRERLSEADSRSRPTLADDSEVKHNELGQIVEVRAADPRSVLFTYCRAVTVELCDPVELALTDPPHPQLRLGIYRGLHDMQAIRIRRDATSGQWVAGDGTREIHAYLARSLRMSGDRLIVENLD